MESTKRRNSWVILVIVGLLCLIVGAVGGAAAGGLVGYTLGRRGVSSPQSRKADGGRQQEVPQGEAPAPQPWGQLPSPWGQMPQGQMPWGQMPNTGINQSGALVTEVVAGTAAEKAGLKQGDLIVAVDSDQVGAQHTLPDLIAQHKPGDQVDLAVVRNNETLHLQVTLGAYPDQTGKAYLGVRVLNLGVPAGKEQ